MKTLQHFEAFQKFERFCVQTIGHIAALGVAFFLVLAWLITGPIFRLSDRIATEAKQKQTKKLEGQL
jgi:low affinity Fe/Cu permease